jgi:type IV secretory pathway component VirB8
MGEASRSIARSIKNGQYFVDARNWYSVYCLYPKIERSFYFLLLSALVVILFIAFSFYTVLSNNVENMTFVTYPENTIKQETKIFNLDRKTDPKIAVLKYLVENYTVTWEKYDYNTISDQVNFIVNNSSEDLGQFFSEFMSINNTNSPLFFYQQSQIREIKIITSEIDDRKKIAKITFQANVINLNNNNAITSSTKWNAYINYSISDLQSLIESKAKKIDFTVLKYQSVKVQ